MYAENCKDTGNSSNLLGSTCFFRDGKHLDQNSSKKRTGKTPCVIVVFDQKMFAETIGLCHSSHLPGLGSCFGENVDEKNRTYVF